MSKKITCVITGKTITVSDLWFDKKVKEYGSEVDLSNLYTSREARSLIKRGYSVDECRSMLKVEKKMNPISSDVLDKIKKITDDDPLLANSGILKSSPDVIDYIKTLKKSYDISTKN
jgi:hypothetical protein